VIESIADLVAFLTKFHRHWLRESALDSALIPADLPDGLATIYRELGALVEIQPGPENDWRAPFATQDVLLPLSRLKRVDGMIEFAWENQGNWSARCPVGYANPPVYSNSVDLGDTVPRGFVVVCDSLNHFLTTLCLQEAVMGCRNLAALSTNRPLDQLLTVALQPLWLNGHYVFGEPDHQFFVSADSDLLVMQSDVVWVGSPLQDVRSLIVQGADCRMLD
jgi:hypothetical protein